MRRQCGTCWWRSSIPKYTRNAEYPDRLVFSKYEHEGLHDILEYYSSLLEDCIACGNQIHETCCKFGDPCTQDCLNILYHGVLERMHGVAALLASPSIESCRPVLRSQIELCIQIQFLTQSKINDYSKAFLVGVAHHNLLLAESFDPTTELGSRIRQLATSEIQPGTSPPATTNFTEEQARFDDLQKHKRLGSAHQEWTRTFENTKPYKHKRPHERKWYMLWNGPTSVYGLFDAVSQLPLYEFLYRDLSNSTHGPGTMFAVVGGIPQIGMPKGIQNIVAMSLNYYMMASRLIAEKCSLTASVDWARTYTEVLRDRFLDVCSREYINFPN